jgi:hypothetical protein
MADQSTRRRWYQFSLGMFLLVIGCGILLAQFSAPTHFIHRKFAPGHVGFPGGFSVVERWGWPLVFLKRYSPNWDEPANKLYGRELAIDAAVALFIVASSGAVAFRLRPTFTVGSFLVFLTGTALFLALRAHMDFPSQWYLSAIIQAGILCACITPAAALFRFVGNTFADFLRRRRPCDAKALERANSEHAGAVE